MPPPGFRFLCVEPYFDFLCDVAVVGEIAIACSACWELGVPSMVLLVQGGAVHVHDVFFSWTFWAREGKAMTKQNIKVTVIFFILLLIFGLIREFLKMNVPEHFCLRS